MARMEIYTPTTVTAQEADFAASELAVTGARFDVVDFSPVISSSPVTFYTRAPGPKDKIFSFIYPFQYSVWLSILLALSVSAVFFWWLLKSTGKKKNYKLLTLFMYLYGYLVAKGCAKKFKRSPVRIFISSWMIFAILITLSYDGVLLSLIFAPATEEALHTVTDLVKAIDQGRYSCGVVAGSYYQDIFLNTHDESAVAKIGDHIRKKGLVFPPDVNKALHLVQKSNVALIHAKLPYLVANDPDKFHVSNDFFFIVYGAAATRKNFRGKTAIDKIIYRVYEAGLYNKWTEDTKFQLRNRRPNSNETLESRALNFHDMKGVFAFLLLGYLASILVLVSEIIRNKCIHFLMIKRNHAVNMRRRKQLKTKHKKSYKDISKVKVSLWNE